MLRTDANQIAEGTRVVFPSIEQEDVAASHAFDVLSPLAGWAAVQECLSRGNLQYLRTSRKLTSPAARRRGALRHFTFQAITYLDLVSSSVTADAYCNVLPLMVREAYTYVYGAPPQVARPVSGDTVEFERRIEFRFRRWMLRAYQRAQRANRLNEPSTERIHKLGKVGPRGVASMPTPDKGNRDILRLPSGAQKKFVTVQAAFRFGGVSRRAIEKAVARGDLKAVGKRQNRRISVDSLLKYFPPEK
jgi:hypothetical protein